MVLSLIVAHCAFTTKFLNKVKSQFHVIFGQDSFPLKMSPFQVGLLKNSTDCLLANGLWNTCFYHYFFFTKNKYQIWDHTGSIQKQSSVGRWKIVLEAYKGINVYERVIREGHQNILFDKREISRNQVLARIDEETFL